MKFGHLNYLVTNGKKTICHSVMLPWWASAPRSISGDTGVLDLKLAFAFSDIAHCVHTSLFGHGRQNLLLSPRRQHKEMSHALSRWLVPCVVQGEPTAKWEEEKYGKKSASITEKAILQRLRRSETWLTIMWGTHKVTGVKKMTELDELKKKTSLPGHYSSVYTTQQMV